MSIPNDTLLATIHEGVATFTLNRPQARNALNAALCEALYAACAQASSNAEIRLVIIRAGDFSKKK